MFHKRIVTGVVATITVFGGGWLIASNNPNRPHSGSDAGRKNSIVMQDYEFTPAELRIPVGATVTWVQHDDTTHTVTPSRPNATFPGIQSLSKDQTYVQRFDAPGTYEYYCEPHPYMKGRIIVE